MNHKNDRYELIIENQRSKVITKKKTILKHTILSTHVESNKIYLFY